MRTALVFALLCGLLAAPPAAAFDYVVDGAQPVQVSVDDDLALAGAIAAGAGYAMPLLVTGIRAGFSDEQNRNNALTGVALSTPPVVGGLLAGQHFLDEMEAQDAQEGFAALPAMLLWGASLAQVVGLTLVGVSFLTATSAVTGA